MLDDCDVKAERKTEEARLRQACLTRQRANSPSRTADVTIQIRFQTDNEDLIRQIMQLASASNVVLVKVEESDLEIGGNYCESTQGWDDAQNISMSLNDYYNVSQVFDPRNFKLVSTGGCGKRYAGNYRQSTFYLWRRRSGGGIHIYI